MKIAGRITGLILLLVSMAFALTYQDSFALSCSFAGNPPPSSTIIVNVHISWLLDKTPGSSDTIITGDIMQLGHGPTLFFTKTYPDTDISRDSVKVKVVPICDKYRFTAKYVNVMLNRSDTTISVKSRTMANIAYFDCQPSTGVKSIATEKFTVKNNLIPYDMMGRQLRRAPKTGFTLKSTVVNGKQIYLIVR
jgi:hypothetical protein